MKKELLGPNLLASQIEERLEELEKILMYKKRNYSDLPEGHLRIAQISKKPQYYHCTDPADSNGHFIPRAEDKLAKALAQKDYDKKVIKLLENEIKASKYYLKQIGYYKCRKNTQTEIDNLYSRLCRARQELITAVTYTPEKYSSEWLKLEWEGKPFSENLPFQLTQKGEKVRSKSEVLIADSLARHKIPYRYEYPLTLKRDFISTTNEAEENSITIYPDFLCLNPRTRKEYYWEHFGLMDNPEYVEKVVSKLNLYNYNDIFQGRNLIITMENQKLPFTYSQIEKIIEKFFC